MIRQTITIDTRSSPDSTRPLLVLVTGPVHLFRTTGLYLLHGLLKKYDVILVGEENYRDEKTFQIAREWSGVCEVYFLPSFFDTRRYHKAALTIARHLARRNPSVLLQHSEFFPHNLYFISCMPRGCRRATFANGFTLDIKTDFTIINAQSIGQLAERFGLPLKVARRLWRIRAWLRYCLHYVLLPAMLQRRRLRTPMDPMSGTIFFHDTAHLTDIHFIYTAREAALYGQYFQPGRIEIVLHPAQSDGAPVHALIGAPAMKKQIALLPTWGLVSTLAEKAGGVNPAVQLMADNWVDVLRVLRSRLGEIPVYVKLHPLAGDNVAMQQIVGKVLERVPFAQVLDPKASAERLILESSCIVSDVSSALWWAIMQGDRIVVSVDKWGLPGNDEFAHHSGAVYVRGSEELASCALLSPAVEKDQKSRLTAVLAKDMEGGGPVSAAPSPLQRPGL